MNFLRSLLLCAALTAWPALGCVNVDELKQEVAELKARQARVEKLATRLIQSVAAALAEAEEAQREFAMALGGR